MGRRNRTGIAAVVVVVVVDGGDDVDEEGGCADEVADTVAVAEIVGFAAFLALAVVAVVDFGSSCLPVMLMALEAWFERDTTAFCWWLKSLPPRERRKISEA